MKSPLLRLVSFSIALFAGSLVGTAWAADATLPVVADTWLNGNNPNANLGDKPAINVNTTTPKIGLAQFDIAALAGSDVESATLKFFVNTVKIGGTLDLHLIQQPWNESTVTLNTAPLWEVAPFASVAVSSQAVGTVVSVDVTYAVQQWASDPASNYGIALLTDDADVALDSKEKAGGTPMVIEATTSTGSVPARTRVNVPADFPTIQEAIDAINSSWCPSANWDDSPCTIVVAPGEFAGFNYDAYFAQFSAPHLTVVGAGESVTVIGKTVFSNRGRFSLSHVSLSAPCEVPDMSLYLSGSADLDHVTVECINVRDGDYDLKDVKVGTRFWSSCDNSGCSVRIDQSKIGAAYFGYGSYPTVRNSVLGPILVRAGETNLVNSSVVGDIAPAVPGDTIARLRVMGSSIRGNITTEGGVIELVGSSVTGNVTNDVIVAPSLIGNSLVGGGFATGFVGKCTNVLNANFDEYQPDCSPPAP